MDGFGRQVMASIIGSFVGYTLASIFMVVISFLVVMVVVAAASLGDAASESGIEENSVFILNLKGDIVEEANPDDQWIEELFLLPSERRQSLGHIVESIGEAAKNENVKSLYLTTRWFGGGLASVQAIRKALNKFKKSGKPIIAYSDHISFRSYYLLSVADKLFINEQSDFSIRGLAAVPTFYKNTLNYMGIKPIVFRVGKYKSAIEPFINEKMSPEYRAQLESLLGDIWQQMKVDIVKSRPKVNVAIEKVPNELVNLNADEAVKMGFFDGAKSESEVLDLLWDTDDEKKRYKVGVLKLIKEKKRNSSTGFDFGESEKDRIAIIYAAGNIILGSSGEETMGSDTVAYRIRKAFRDEKVKAIVIRINSPGGDALASDIMFSQFRESQKKYDKPLVASFSDVAASGGYYMASFADKIVAEPLSITGSIGVFGLMFNVQELMETNLRLTHDRVTTHPYGDFGSGLREMTEFERSRIQKNVNEIYERFLQVVRSKRTYKSRDEVHELAQGQVYTGLQAKKNKLVDQLGGLDDAVETAAKLAKLGEYEIKVIRGEKSPAEKIRESLGIKLLFRSVKLMFGWDMSGESITTLRYLIKNQGVMAWWPAPEIE